MMLYMYPKINVVCMGFHCALSFAFLHVVHLYNKIMKLHSVVSCWLTLIWLILGCCLIVSFALPLTFLQIQLPCHSSAVILLPWRLPRSWDRCLNVLTTLLLVVSISFGWFATRFKNHLMWTSNIAYACTSLITVKPLILATLNFGIWVNLIILDPIILAFLLPSTLKRYCIPIFAARSRTCQAREIREIKGTRKKRVLQYLSQGCFT